MQSLSHTFEAKVAIPTIYVRSLAVCVFYSAQVGHGLENLILLSADFELKTILSKSTGRTS